MKREQVLMVLGVLIALSPWSGLPLAWLAWILPVLGLFVTGIAFTLWGRVRTPTEPELLPLKDPIEPRSSHIAFS